MISKHFIHVNSLVIAFIHKLTIMTLGGVAEEKMSKLFSAENVYWIFMVFISSSFQLELLATKLEYIQFFE